MKNKCWICLRPADSSEHRIKKSDMIRAFGRGGYKGEYAPVHIREDVHTDIQGPNSKTLKYSKSLCRYCNSTRTQPLDRAYDCFMDWVMDNEALVLDKRVIDFHDVYGSRMEVGQRNLFQYFAKSLGCKIVSSKRPVPWDIRFLLFQKKFITGLQITLSVNENLLRTPKEKRNRILGKGALYYIPQKVLFKAFSPYIWHEHVSWFWINYWYRYPPDGSTGTPWIANSQYAYLGSIHNTSNHGDQILRLE